MLDAITIFLDTLPPNTIPADIEIKYAYKCADGTGGWAGLSSTKGSPEKWRQALKANTCELGVFHISSIATENIRREFPYSSQMSQDATVMGTTRVRVSVKFNAEQVVLDAPPTLEVSYSRSTLFSILLNSFICQECIAAVNVAFKTHMHEEDTRLAYFESRQYYGRTWPREIKLYPHSAHGRSNKELGTEEYIKMTIQSPTIIYLEATYELK